MTKRLKAKSPILEAVHETASDLNRLGFIDQRKMHEFDALCLGPIPEYDSTRCFETPPFATLHSLSARYFSDL